MPLKIEGGPIRIPNVKDLIDDELMDRAGKRLVGDVVKNIRDQRQADGDALKQNATSTRKRKQRMGIPQMSLLDIGQRLLIVEKSWKYTTNLKKLTITVEPTSTPQTALKKYTHKNKRTGKRRTSIARNTASAKEIVEWVQEAGYTGWFEMSEAGIMGIADLLSEKIRKELPRLMQKGRKKRG